MINANPTNDVQVALMFFPVIENGIVLTTEWNRNRPYIKREIIRLLGTPDRNDNEFLWYNGRYIRIVAAHREENIRGYKEEQMFHVESWE